MPAGRGNDFFKSLKELSNKKNRNHWQQALEILKNNQHNYIDLGYANIKGTHEAIHEQKIFINVSSFGFPGLVVSHMTKPNKPLHENIIGKTPLTYVFYSLKSFFHYKPLEFEVHIDSKPFYQGPVFSGFVLNGRYNGGKYCWSQEAKLDDGYFHFVLIKPSDFLTNLKTFQRMFHGDWKDLDNVLLSKGKKISLKVTSPCPHPILEIDGELSTHSSALQFEFEIIPKAISVIC